MMALLVAYSLAGLLGESEVPVVCQRDSALPTTTEERIAVSMCAARDRMTSLTHLQDSDVSQRAVEVATAPTFTILDEIIASSTPSWQVIALDLRGDLYLAMAAQLRHAGASSIRVSPWLASARSAYADARMLRLGLEGATTNPDKETQR
jgi:hypothetical protein